VLRCTRDGLSTQDAEARLGRYGPNADAEAKRTSFFGAIRTPATRTSVSRPIGSRYRLGRHRRHHRWFDHSDDTRLLNRSGYHSGGACR